MMIETQPMHEQVITRVNKSFNWSKNKYKTRSIVLDMKKKHTA